MFIGTLRKATLDKRGGEFVHARWEGGNSYKYDWDNVIHIGGEKGLTRDKGVHRGRMAYTEDTQPLPLWSAW